MHSHQSRRAVISGQAGQRIVQSGTNSPVGCPSQFSRRTLIFSFDTPLVKHCHAR
jgi:hypothetical protein